MQSSISPPASSNRRRALALWSAVLGPAIAWLMLLQTNYVLAYPTCAARSHTWLYVASSAGLAALLLLAAIAQSVWRSTDATPSGGLADAGEQQDRPGADPSIASRHFLSLMAVFLSLLFLILVIGTALPPFVLHPCD
jgi:hypothetical protein